MDNQHREITGYRELSQSDIDIMNTIKHREKQVLALLDSVEGKDPRWAAIARTDLEKGFMAAVRSIAKPGS